MLLPSHNLPRIAPNDQLAMIKLVTESESQAVNSAKILIKQAQRELSDLVLGKVRPIPDLRLSDLDPLDPPISGCHLGSKSSFLVRDCKLTGH